MTFIDVPALLEPVRSESPCGPELDYSPLYLEASRALEGSPDAQYGDTHIAAIEPDWKRVKAATLELLAGSHDLRLAVWLTRALVALHGVAAVADGLALIEGLLARFWDELHPQLDADDENDPTARINILLSLDDRAAFVRELRWAPLMVSERHGRVRLHDIESATNDPDTTPASGVGGTALEPAAIEAAFADAALEDVLTLDDALARAMSSLARIDTRVTDRVGQGRWASLPALARVLQRARRAVSAQLARHPASIERAAESAETAHAPASAQVASDRIVSRDDVVRTLDRLCGYYAAAEPSSPVPMLLQRARRLVGMDFAALIADLTPAGVDEAKHWAGSREL
jgi:type VI secretion system protein ImpA